jgi:hypothetical protein
VYRLFNGQVWRLRDRAVKWEPLDDGEIYLEVVAICEISGRLGALDSGGAVWILGNGDVGEEDKFARLP